VVRAVDGVSFEVMPGETLAIVGESGCGKSVTSMSILRLLPMPPARIAEGRIEFDGRNLLELAEPEMRKVRGNAISMIFQEPMTSLNPVLTVGRADRRGAGAAPGHVAQGRDDARVEMLPRCTSGGGAAHNPVSARAVRRHAQR